jgi:filamentous hemagglutinin
LEAPSGKVTLKSTVSDLHLAESARIMATGYNKPETTSLLRGVTVGRRPMAGGTVTLSATRDLVLKLGSILDVSGSEPTQRFLKDDSGNPVRFTVASDPGSVNLAYGGAFVQEAEIRARAWMDTLKGGSFSLSRSSLTEPLLISAKDIEAIQAAGFDALTFRSPKGVAFSGNLDVSVRRALTLNAPVVSAEGAERIAIASPWITLANTYTGANSLAQIPASVGAGETTLLLDADWIDLRGSFVLSGFGQAVLEAGQSIRGYDLRYQDQAWQGMVKTAGHLTLKAGTVYPATLSDFTFRSAGKITVLPGEKNTTGTPLSAGGGLTLESALGIEHRGVLAAPMGRVSLKVTGPQVRVYLAEGSVITTAGKGPVLFGLVDNNGWKYFDKKGGNILADVEGPPAKAVDISAPEVVAMAGSLIDLSGGGSVFAYQFLPGAEGTENPLNKKGRYVIFPGGEFILPGHAVRLEGGAGVPAGVYSLLPPEYAFLPGALVIEKRPEAMVPGDKRLSEAGLPLISGYPAFMGAKGIRSTMPEAYVVRSAAEVLKEGHFDRWSYRAGDGGKLRIAGTSTVLDGRVAVTAMENFKGGVAALSGKEILLGEAGDPLPSAFSFGDPLPSTFRDLLRVNPTIFSGMDLEEIRLGELAVTERLTLETDSLIEASQIALAASKEIILRSGAEIHALGAGGAGTASLISPEGKVTLEEKSLVHASDAVKLEAADIDFRGEIAVDNSAVDLVGARIFFIPEGYSRTGPGLHLTQAQWDRFRLFEHIDLRSRGDLVFLGDFSLAAAGSLSIDAPRIAAAPADGGSANDWNVTLGASKISLLNTGTASTVDTMADTAAITFNASELFIGSGDIRFDGFAKVNLLSESDVTFLGKGALLTGGADLDTTAPRVTTSFYKDEKTSYEVARFTVDAAAGAVTMSAGAGTPGQDAAPGGLLEISGRTIDLSTLVHVNSGQVRFKASGSGANEGIFLRKGAGILAGGSDDAPGGGVELRAEQGKVSVATGSTIDVSAGDQGDSGSVSLFAPVGGVSLEGTLLGHGAGGRGGSFEMDANRISDFSSVNSVLSAGGFTESIGLRARTGNVTIGPGQRVESREFRLAADQGNLSVFGEIDVSGPDRGGLVDLHAGNLLTLHPEARILSRGMNQGAPGGDVFPGTANGYVATLEGSLIDVSGGQGGAGGTVTFRAPRYESSEVYLLPFGAIRGPRDVFV